MKYCAPTPTTRKQAFTLVELLVVVAILALLIALVVPGVSRGLERTRSTACVANLRTLGQGTMAYVLDHRDQIPFQQNGGQGSGYANPPWFNLLAPYAGAVVQSQISLVRGTDKSFRCPTQRGNFAISYGPSSGCLLDGPRLYFSRVRQPTVKAWLIDVPVGNVYFFNPGLPSANWSAPRHDDGVNVLFFDGRVQWLSKEEIEQRRPLMFQPTRI